MKQGKSIKTGKMELQMGVVIEITEAQGEKNYKYSWILKPDNIIH